MKWRIPSERIPSLSLSLFSHRWENGCEDWMHWDFFHSNVEDRKAKRVKRNKWIVPYLAEKKSSLIWHPSPLSLSPLSLSLSLLSVFASLSISPTFVVSRFSFSFSFSFFFFGVSLKKRTKFSFEIFFFRLLFCKEYSLPSVSVCVCGCFVVLLYAMSIHFDFTLKEQILENRILRNNFQYEI